MLEDGSVVTWGREDQGCDSSLVQDQLKSLVQIQNLPDTLELISNQRTVAQMLPLLQFWKLDPSLPGVVKTRAVTVR